MSSSFSCRRGRSIKDAVVLPRLGAENSYVVGPAHGRQFDRAFAMPLPTTTSCSRRLSAAQGLLTRAPRRGLEAEQVLCVRVHQVSTHVAERQETSSARCGPPVAAIEAPTARIRQSQAPIARCARGCGAFDRGRLDRRQPAHVARALRLPEFRLAEDRGIIRRSSRCRCRW